MSIVVTLNEEALNFLLTSEQGPVGLWLLRQGLRVEAEAKRLCSGVMVKVQTGRLSGSITAVLARDGRGLIVRVGTNVEYALFVHEGTSEHDIYPRGRVAGKLMGVYGFQAKGGTQALRWTDADGEVHFAAKVHHPGTRARPFLRVALEILY